VTNMLIRQILRPNHFGPHWELSSTIDTSGRPRQPPTSLSATGSSETITDADATRPYDQPGRLRRPTHSDGTSRLTLCPPNRVKPRPSPAGLRN